MAEATKKKSSLPELTPEERERNRARGRVSRKNLPIVRAWLEELAAADWAAYREDPENNNHPNATLLYGLVGFPWIEDEDGFVERDEEAFNEGVAKHYNAPDIEFLTENADETIELFELDLNEDGFPIPIEVEEEGELPYKTHMITVPLADAIRRYVLGFKENGTTGGGLTVKWLLELEPGVGSTRSKEIIENSGIKTGATLRELRRVQYADLLVFSGAEELAEDEDEEDEEDFIEEDDVEIDETDETLDDDVEADDVEDDDSEDDEESDLDSAAEDFVDDAEDGEVEEEAEDDE